MMSASLPRRLITLSLFVTAPAWAIEDDLRDTTSLIRSGATIAGLGLAAGDIRHRRDSWRLSCRDVKAFTFCEMPAKSAAKEESSTAVLEKAEKRILAWFVDNLMDSETPLLMTCGFGLDALAFTRYRCTQHRLPLPELRQDRWHGAQSPLCHDHVDLSQASAVLAGNRASLRHLATRYDIPVPRPENANDVLESNTITIFLIGIHHLWQTGYLAANERDRALDTVAAVVRAEPRRRNLWSHWLNHGP